MADGAGDGSEGATIPTALFYSARRLPRSRRPRLEDPDIIFAALGNGDISDIDDDEEEVDEAGELDDAVDGDWDNQQELSDSSDEEEPDKESAREYGSWCRKPFEKPAAEFTPVADENESYRDPLLTPYEYFSKSVSNGNAQPGVLTALLEPDMIEGSKTGKTGMIEGILNDHDIPSTDQEQITGLDHTS
ncbi:hypothetical protein V5799_010198, partial [Amblyomma americanum]